MPKLLITANVAEMFRDFLLPYARYFRAQGWSVDAMANGIRNSGECAAAFDRVIDIRWSRDPFDVANMMHASRQIAREIELSGYDVIHAHTPIAGFISRMAARRRVRRLPKVVYTAHGFHFHPHGRWLTNHIYRRLESMAGRWTDYLVVINHTDEEAARKYEIVPADRLIYMPGIGIDLSRYRAANVSDTDVRTFRTELGLSEKNRIVLMIAEFTPVKRHCDAVRAFNLLRDTSTHLVFAGEGPLMSEIRQLAQSLDLYRRIHFVGYRRDIPVLLRAAAAMILPSEREGLPRSIMEALSVGTPVIASNIRGCRDLLAGGSGVLFPVGDYTCLSEAIGTILRDPANTAEMTQRGRQTVERYDIRHILRLHETLYSRALAA